MLVALRERARGERLRQARDSPRSGRGRRRAGRPGRARARPACRRRRARPRRGSRAQVAAHLGQPHQSASRDSTTARRRSSVRPRASRSVGRLAVGPDELPRLVAERGLRPRRLACRASIPRRTASSPAAVSRSVGRQAVVEVVRARRAERHLALQPGELGSRSSSSSAARSASSSGERARRRIRAQESAQHRGSAIPRDEQDPDVRRERRAGRARAPRRSAGRWSAARAPRAPGRDAPHVAARSRAAARPRPLGALPLARLLQLVPRCLQRRDRLLLHARVHIVLRELGPLEQRRQAARSTSCETSSCSSMRCRYSAGASEALRGSPKAASVRSRRAYAATTALRGSRSARRSSSESASASSSARERSTCVKGSSCAPTRAGGERERRRPRPRRGRARRGRGSSRSSARSPSSRAAPSSRRRRSLPGPPASGRRFGPPRTGARGRARRGSARRSRASGRGPRGAAAPARRASPSAARRATGRAGAEHHPDEVEADERVEQEVRRPPRARPAEVGVAARGDGDDAEQPEHDEQHDERGGDPPGPARGASVHVR